jgi:hypothetical protein
MTIAFKMADRVKAVATEEALHFKELAEEAARSGAYFYPFKVITYLLSKEKKKIIFLLL